jgi:hypothetical protein
LIENSVIWGNRFRGSTPVFSVEAAQVNHDLMFGTLDINHCLIEGWSGLYGGVGNSGDDPLFVDALGLDGLPGTGDEDFRLSAESPAIDAGDPAYAPVPGATDLDGVPRVLCDRIDIGAYEYGIGDYDCDRVVDLLDFAAWESCMTGPVARGDGPWTAFYGTGCESFDSQCDGDVDLEDYQAIQRVHFGP